MNDAVPTGSSPTGGAATTPGAVAYRGFLFADLRGYTAFVEQRGPAAAADLLDAYRALVRDEVARHAGSEVRTEGDSFYVVFTSARGAVACALDIVAAADKLTKANPERPIRVGIGVNAGETVQREEGFVGSAVNIAARVCAEAREGEVLITPTVRDAVGAGAGLRFEPRGTRRLKGISQPMPLIAVEPEGAPARRGSRRSRPSVGVLALGAVAVIALAAAVIGMSVSGFGAASTASSPPAPPSEASATQNADVTDPGAFPNAAETGLLALLDDSIATHCQRGDDDDRPVYRLDPVTSTVSGAGRIVPLQTVAELECSIPSINAPDVVHYWKAAHTLFFRPAEAPDAVLYSQAGALDVPNGDCSDGVPAIGSWEFGDFSGTLMCREAFGDAILEWSYDDRGIVGRAVRRDGDHAALMRWWEEQARLLRP